MLVSTLLTPAQLFGDLRAVVVDEVHAFAGDDRGWHLLAVLERLGEIAGRPLQRIGLSATVGNPSDLLTWLQGSGSGSRPSSVVAPEVAGGTAATMQLDFVGSVDNAARVVAALHQGQKRLVFADSRRTVESVALSLRDRETTTFVSHSSLSVDERRRAETAFAEARDCVIVSTSTLELGIDVGDLDQVLQVGAPRTVSSVLQRLGRSGRRAGTSRSMVFLAVTEDELLRDAGLLLLWGEGFVEPVVPPPSPRHLVAQQLLALCLQQGRVGEATWHRALHGLDLADEADLAAVAAWLLESGHLDRDGGMLFVGPEAEARFGRRNFLELLSVFTSDPAFTLLHGRSEIGTVDPLALTRKVDGPRLLSLGGRSWLVGHIDWKRRRAFVEPVEQRGVTRWSGTSQPLSYSLCDAMRRVLLGADPAGTTLSQRAVTSLEGVRAELCGTVWDDATIVRRWDSGQVRWWTWAGARANGTVAAALAQVAPGLVDELERYDNRYVKLHGDATVSAVRSAVAEARRQFGADLDGVEQEVSPEALKQLKFAELLPPELARRTLASRAADPVGARAVLSAPVSEG